MPVSIRSHLLILVLVILVPALLGASWLVASTIQAERRANERTLRDASRSLSMLVDRELEQRAAVARVLAQSRLLDGSDEMQPEALARFAEVSRRGLRDMPGWVELRAAGQVLLDTRRPVGEPVQRSSVPPLSPRATVLSEIEPDGTAQGDVAVVEPVMRNGAPVLNVVVTLPAGELQRLVDAHAMPADAQGTVLDAQGVVMAQHPASSAAVGRLAPQALRAQLAGHREGLVKAVTAPGESTVAYFNTTPQGWTYVSGLASDRYNGLYSATVQQVLLGTLVLVVIAGLAAAVVSRRVVAPVMALKEAARRMQAGQPVQTLRTGIVECDEVGRALADASEAIQDSRAELERQVADAVARTRLAEQRVSQGQRVGALGRLTGGVAHDFNNLLGIISNNAHLIQRHPAAADLQRPIASTLRAVEVGSQLTQHLLRFAGRRPVRPQRVHLAQYLPEVEALMRSMLGQRVKISVQVHPVTAPIHVDPGELELALINLGLNARDAMPDGGELRLQARNADALDAEGLPVLDPPRPWVVLTVSDDGEGIDPELVGRVFEPFFTTKGPGKGSGLGLSQVHGFCVQAGGVARLDSTPGLGTAVSMLMPASEGTGGAAAPAAPAPSAAAPLVAGLRVLVVEDNDELGDATAALLRAHGAQVVRVDGADPALAHLQGDKPFDVVLSDIVMPGEMDGYALAQWIRQHRPSLPVVLVSGYHQAPAKSQFRVLTKPCPQDELLTALRDAAMGASSASGLPGA